MRYLLSSIFLLLSVMMYASCNTVKKEHHLFASHAQTTLDSLYKYYGVNNYYLLRETYPFDSAHKATYLAGDDAQHINQYSYLWPYSGTLSSAIVLYEMSDDNKYKTLIDERILPGLEEYLDTKRTPAGYSSYINTAAVSDRFYDDNVWLGIDFTDIYLKTKEDKYLAKAQLIWNFIASGIDDKLGGGIYWCEQKKESKNTCSNAPGTVLALKLFIATQDSTFFRLGKDLYTWTKKHLQDPSDYLYYDNIKPDGSVSKAKYAYNSGQMLQAAAMLYQLTNDQSYLIEAQNIAKSSYNFFFEDYTSPGGESFRLLKNTDVWFIAVMMRGFIELYHIDNNRTYIDCFAQNLNHAWQFMRDSNGLFNVDWRGEKKDEKKWLLTQAGMIEIYARLAVNIPK